MADKPKTQAAANPSAPAKPKETPRARFVRLANRRVSNAVKRLQHVANLANRHQYEYTPAEAENISVLLTASLAKLQHAFKGNGNGSSSEVNIFA